MIRRWLTAIALAAASLLPTPADLAANLSFGPVYEVVSPGVTDDYPAFVDVALSEGIEHVVWRQGADHNSTPGEIAYANRLASASSDTALSTPVVALARDPEVVTDPMVYVTATGRIWVATTENNGGTLKGIAAYSDNGGTSFTDFGYLPTHSALGTRHSPISMFESGGKLYCALYGVGAAGVKYQLALIESSDDGDTWSDTAVILNGNTYGWSPEEPVIRKLSDGSFLLLFRDDDRGNQMLYANTTDLTSWPLPGAVFARSYSRSDWTQLSNGLIVAPVRGKAFGGVEGQPMLVVLKKTAAGVIRWTDLIPYDSAWAGAPEYQLYAAVVEIAPGVVDLFWSTHTDWPGPARVRTTRGYVTP